MATLVAYVRADATLDIPVVPWSWEVTVQDNRWSTVYPQGRSDGKCFHARLIARDGSQPNRAVFVCTGKRNQLDKFATKIANDALAWTMTWDTLGALRADNGATATSVKGKWVDERPHALSGPINAPVDSGPVGNLVGLYARVAGELNEDGES